ncbi:malonic semialdehyde reductase RutE [Candidatus Anstonella stagnisolia]|nr:malonic semialdehyde reductase RutE [Candidatus Anstonella stagnisolia]
MEFGKIVMERYATKKFDGKTVPHAKMDELFELIRFSASSFGMQPWKIKVVTDQKLKDTLMAASWGQPQIGTCSHLLVFCADTNLDALISKMQGQLSKTDMPAESLEGYVNMMRDFVKAMDGAKKLAWAQRQVYLALGNAINGAKSLGLDSCPMEGFNPVEYSRILKLPENIVPTALCPVGYAADKPRAKMRFAKDEIFF